MVRLQKDLREFVELLIERRVEFVVVGGYAVAFHGHPRFTQDIDLFVRADQANAKKLTLLVKDFGFEALGLTEEHFYDPNAVIQLGRPPNRVDLLTQISGVTFDEVWEGRVSGRLDDLEVSYISRDLLIKNKVAAGRGKDLGDVSEL